MSYCHQSVIRKVTLIEKLLTFFLVKIFFRLPPLFKIPGSAPDSGEFYGFSFNESTAGADASVEVPKLHNIKLLIAIALYTH